MSFVSGTRLVCLSIPLFDPFSCHPCPLCCQTNLSRADEVTTLTRGLDTTNAEPHFQDRHSQLWACATASQQARWNLRV